MLMTPPSVKIFISTRPIDMRRSFDGLSAIVTEIIGKDPYSGHLFVFCNRRKDRTKILWWDRSGFCLFYKRIEEGAFHFPAGAEANVGFQRSHEERPHAAEENRIVVEVVILAALQEAEG